MNLAYRVPARSPSESSIVMQVSVNGKVLFAQANVQATGTTSASWVYPPQQLWTQPAGQTTAKLLFMATNPKGGSRSILLDNVTVVLAAGFAPTNTSIAVSSSDELCFPSARACGDSAVTGCSSATCLQDADACGGAGGNTFYCPYRLSTEMAPGSMQEQLSESNPYLCFKSTSTCKAIANIASLSVCANPTVVAASIGCHSNQGAYCHGTGNTYTSMCTDLTYAAASANRPGGLTSAPVPPSSQL